MMVEPRDAYWQLGRVFLRSPGDARPADIANHFRGWLVKAYFFPLMFVWLHNSVHNIINFDLTGADWSNLRVYDFLYTTVFGVDLLFTTAGYALSMKVIDTHIRSAEPTMLGWTVALFCYEPFFSSVFYKQYVNYDGPGLRRHVREPSHAALDMGGRDHLSPSRFIRSPRSPSVSAFRTSRTEEF